jgi:hypothetical protein
LRCGVSCACAEHAPMQVCLRSVFILGISTHAERGQFDQSLAHGESIPISLSPFLFVLLHSVQSQKGPVDDDDMMDEVDRFHEDGDFMAVAKGSKKVGFSLCLFFIVHKCPI